MASRKRKEMARDHARLLELRHTKFVTQSALENLLRNVEAEGPIHGCSRRTQYRVRKAVAYTATPYGPRVKPIEHDGTKFGLSPPLASMWNATRHSGS